jgi:hypothetical protein
VSDALTGNRQFTKNIPATTIGYNELTGNFTATNGWRVEENAVYYETYWDMSPYTLNDLTYFPITAVLQDGMPHLFSVSNPTDINMQILDIVSQVPLQIGAVRADLLINNPPGSPLSTEDFTQMVMCQYRFMLPTTQFSTSTLMTPATLGQFGSLEPTAIEKLYIYRIIVPATANRVTGDTIGIPATRFIMNGAVAKESELEYMMRLKRSYELAQ